MEDIVNILVNNGAMLGCLVYFMYRDFKFMNLITEVLTKLQQSTEIIIGLLKERED